MAAPPVIVVEDDPFTRMVPLVLDPNASKERFAAFADFMAHDEPDFAGWAERVRKGSPGLYPADVRLMNSEEDMRAHLGQAQIVVVESFRIGAADLAKAPKLKIVQKFGTGLRNIDAAACKAKGVKLLTLRRRANIACAEHCFALMLTLARKLETVSGLVSVARIKEAGLPFRPFDRRHTPGGNYPRVGGTSSLYGATIGIIGLGEIGREIAQRATAFGMNVLYYQRTRAAEVEENVVGARYVPLATLLAESDWIVPQVPTAPYTRDLLGRAELSRIKPGACIVNVANAPIVNRDALIEALRSGRARRRRARHPLQGAGAGRRRAFVIRQRHHDAAHGGLAAFQRSQRLRGDDYHPGAGVRDMKPIAVALMLLAAAPAAAQDNWPDKPVRIVVPFPAGSATDIVSRLMGQKFSARFGQQFVIENRPGASGNLGVDIIAKSAPDGYTIGLITASTHGVTPALGTKLPYDSIKDFKPISMIGATPYVLVLYPGIPAKSIAELIALAKAKPGALNYGSAGLASLAHLAAALFANDTGIELAHVPYKSSAQSSIDIITGRLDMQFATVGPTLENIRDGKLRALATTGRKRVSSLPEVPTMIEAGVKDYDVTLWIAYVTPAGVPDAIIAKLNGAMNAILNEPDIVATLQKQGFEPEPGPPEAVTARIQNETEKWRALVANTGIKTE